MAHEIPNELLEREIFHITDVVGDSLYCINGITPERVIRTAFKWCLDKGLITNPIYIK